METSKHLALAFALAGIATPALPANADPALAPALSWAGPYVGISGGGGWGNSAQQGGFLVLPSRSTTPITPPPVADGHYGLSGGLVGGGAGYNFQIERLVFGLEGDGSWADITGSGTCGFFVSFPHECGGGVRALGTVRARVGYDLGAFGPLQGVLAYATGGLAIGDVHGWDSLFGASGSAVEAGWTVGGGLETKLMPNWSVKVEYLYVDLGDHGVFTAVPPNVEHVSARANIVRVGLNYHFDLSATPVIAKY
jgi:outer membrane immunogenic protein